jgi:protein-tyrosine phosphatase
VVLLSEIEHDEIITRKLQLIHQDAIREITHLQYTGWMDFNVPENPLGLLQVVSMANENRTDSPIIVHCSAGCGRSGAFCVIDTVISRLKKEEGDQDVLLETISCFREQRLSMVQTLRQFVFCYEVILWLMGLD